MRTTGKVKWFSEEKGFGFITVAGSSQDIFCHFSAIKGMKGRKNLHQGDTVEFDIVPGEKGSRAESIILVERPQ